MIRFFKELYLTGYVFFYRASSRSWSHAYNVGKGIAGVSLFVSLILMGINAWIEILVGKQFFIPHVSRFDGWVEAFIIFLVNYYILAIRGLGVGFEKDFNNLKKSKQTFLQVSCCVMQIISVIFFIFSGYAYRHFFHIIPKY
ncbi:MAG TPA: hypothetical protein VK840_05665 [Candidatus Dormibacteraeota bacterium]|jgi:hypothetical protein|nr:hypothetical protein [Candidatus Dormibacteraeota bacterium]